MKKPLAVFLLVFLLFNLWVGVASAQATTPSDDEVNAIAKELFCPVCENTPLDVCPTEACKQWRELIRLKLSEGWSKEQIQDYFVEQYGARVLAEPPRQGWYWLIYLMPVALFGVGIFILYRAYQSMRQPLPLEADEAQPPASPSLSDADLRRVEEELNKRK
jgi:cytochrome c-type biogenesis protein CcmH